MAESLEVVPGFVIPQSELHERFSHSSGPGGQGVNTSDSRVELSFDLARAASVPEHLRPVLLAALGPRLVDGVLTIAVQDERTQFANRRLARARLVTALQEACVQRRRRRPTRRTRGSQARRLEAKKRRSEIKRNRRRPTW